MCLYVYIVLHPPPVQPSPDQPSQEHIPSFLEQVADKVLRTGKYLNVIRECGREVEFPEAKGIRYTVQERQYVEHIEEVGAPDICLVSLLYRSLDTLPFR